MRFQPTTTEFCWDALTNWAIRPWVQLAFRASFVLLLRFHLLFSVRFHFRYCLRSFKDFFEGTNILFCSEAKASFQKLCYFLLHWEILVALCFYEVMFFYQYVCYNTLKNGFLRNIYVNQRLLGKHINWVFYNTNMYVKIPCKAYK